MARLYGTVRYRLLPASRLPNSPVCAYVDRDRNVQWAVDEAQMDPLLGRVFSTASAAMEPVLPILRPTLLQVYRDRALGGSQLYIAELDESCIHARVPHELVTCDVAREISRHGTLVLRALLGMCPPSA